MIVKTAPAGVRRALVLAAGLALMVVGLDSGLAQTRPRAGQAQAQQPAQPQPPPVPNAPDRTTASFGDWVLRCERAARGGETVRVCEVAQSIQIQGQQGPIAQVAIGRIRRNDPLKVTLVLPTNVTLTDVPKVVAEDKEGRPVDTAWLRCVPGACLADAALPDDMVARMRARTAPGRIEFTDGAGRKLAVPVSWRGVSQALDALARES